MIAIRIPSLAALVGLSLLLLPGCRREPEPPPAVEAVVTLEPLLKTMNDRLVLIHDVARIKWNTKQPISDPAREKAMLDALGETAAKRGQDPAEVRAFFVAQVEAAKLIQQANFDRWQREKLGPFPNVPDLSVTRAKLDGLSQRLLEAYLVAKPDLARVSESSLMKDAEQHLHGDGITTAVRATAISPLIVDANK